MSNFNGTLVTPSRILSMAETRPAHEIAATLRIDEEVVLDVLQGAGRIKAVWTVRCNKSGRTYKARSERGAYRLAHLMGLTDWDSFHGEPPKPQPVERKKVPAGPERDAVIRRLREGGATIRMISQAVGANPKTIKSDMARMGLSIQ